MKKKNGKRHSAKKNRQVKHRRFKRELIPLAAILVIAFYICSLIALYKAYPLVFSAGKSQAETDIQNQPIGDQTWSHTSQTETSSTTSQTNPVSDAVSSDSVGWASNTSSESSSRVNIKPVLTFVKPSDDSVLSGEVSIVSKIDFANSIEFYIEKNGSLSSQYLGKAKRDGDTGAKWHLKVNTEDIPNAKYELSAKITNDYGAYESKSINIKVHNEPVVSSRDEDAQSNDSQDGTGTNPNPSGSNSENTTDTTSDTTTTGSTDDVGSTSSTSSNTESSTTNTNSGEEQVPTDSGGSSGTTGNSSSTTAPSTSSSAPNSSAPSGSSASDQPASSTPSTQTSQEIQSNVSERVEQRANSTGNSASNTSAAGTVSRSQDSDQDGVSNEEERRLGTDPDSADTDKDGYLDGDEIKNGYNPLKASANGKNDKIVYESPKEKGETKKDLIKVASVQLAEKKTGEKEKEPARAIELKGKGLPNSFITLYIYSETPTIVTISTDANGNWTYELDKALSDGEHETYAAITDNEGHITAKSEPFRFIKTAQAVVAANEPGDRDKLLAAVQSPVASSKPNSLLFIGIVIILSLFAALALIGLYILYSHHAKENVIHKDYLIGN